MGNIRENEMRFVAVQLIEEIIRANCWHDIKRAADALFHARLVWEPFDKECRRFEEENLGIVRDLSVEGNGPPEDEEGG
jgi:hypothetical protein